MKPRLVQRISLLLAASLCALPTGAWAAEGAQPPALQHVYIKTRTQTFNQRFYYVLQDGKIWFRPNQETTGQDQPWTLMGCEGLPCQPDNPDFVVPTAIQEISADADELTALDVNQRFYVRTSAGPGLFSKDEWVMTHGFPKDLLEIPEALRAKRALSMGRRHYDVLWHEDADNNVHHYGTMGTSTLYMLSPTGHEILYTDNGLPTDFSNQICGPERGAFVAENLQASAGVLFVINRAGEMYTHLNDFDLNGGTSMFIDYTYTPQPHRPHEKGSDYNTHLTPWRLPLQDWHPQPTIPLSGSAQISTEITILQNGNGNAARELRVAGRNADGEPGYWHKAILAPEWQFRAAPVTVESHAWLKPGQRAPRVQPQDVDYREVQSQRPYTLELLKFNYHCSPSTLRLKWADRQLDLKLYTTDAWINVRRDDPGRDGTPILLLGTLEATSEQLAELPEPFKSLHLETFGLQLAATTDQVLVYNPRSEVIARLNRVSPVPASLKTFNYDYHPPLATFASALFRDQHESYLRLRDPALLRWDLSSLTPADLPELDALIARNRERLAHYEHGYALIQAAESEAWAEAVGTALLRNLYTLIGAPYWLPYARVTARVAPELLWAYYAVDEGLNQQSKLDYRRMIQILRHRIARYTEHREALRQRAED